MKRLNNNEYGINGQAITVTKPHAAMKRLNTPDCNKGKKTEGYKTARGYEALKQNGILLQRRSRRVTKPHAAMKRLNSVP